MKRPLVDPFRALQFWNRGGETLAQIADRFVGVKEKAVREAIEFVISNGLGTLARPLPTKAALAPKAPKAPKQPRPPRPPKEAKQPRPPAAPIPKNLPRAASFNPVVETILAEAQPPAYNRREWARLEAQWTVEMIEQFFAAGNTEWSGQTYRLPWFGPERVKRALQRAGRKDLWQKAKTALRLWRIRVAAPL